MSKYKANNFFHSLSFAVRGLLLALNSQRNFVIEIVISFIVLTAALYFRLTNFEIALLFLTIGFVLFAELTNTVIEFIVDAYFGNKYSILAKMAKDTSAGAVFLSSLIAAIIGLLLFYPKIKIIFLSIL